MLGTHMNTKEVSEATGRQDEQLHPITSAKTQKHQSSYQASTSRLLVFQSL